LIFHSFHWFLFPRHHHPLLHHLILLHHPMHYLLVFAKKTKRIDLKDFNVILLCFPVISLSL
jgi:hypothetical protein